MKFVPGLTDSLAHPRVPQRKNKRRTRGFTLTEVLLATAAFALVGMLFSATFPLAGRIQQSGRNRTIAVRIARREMEALRQLGYAGLDNGAPNSMYTATYPVIDSGTTLNQVCTEAKPCTFSNLAADGTGAAATVLPSGRADFWISETDPVTMTTGKPLVPQTNLRCITVRVRWTEFGIARTLTFVSLIANTVKTG